MVLVANARTITLANAMTDVKALVVCKDALGIATMGTDFVFDALNPAIYTGDTLPVLGAQIGGATVLAIIVPTGGAGSGGADGTYPFTSSGGGGSGLAGTFTVIDGAVAYYTVTNGGAYTSVPVIGHAACPGLTGAGPWVQLGTLRNLARDIQPALARTQPIALTASVYASRPAFDGKALAFAKDVTTALTLVKAGTPGGRICEPYFEGFIDFFEIVVCKANSFPASNNSPYMVTGGGGGIQLNTFGVPASKETAVAFGSAVPVGKLATLAKRVRFNVEAGTSNIIGYVGLDGTVTPSSQLAGKAISAYSTAGNVPTVIGGSSGSAANSWDGGVAYVYRELIGVSGRTDADVLAVVKQVHEASLARWA